MVHTGAKLGGSARLPRRQWLRAARRAHNPLLRPPSRADRLAVASAVLLALVAALAVALGTWHVYSDGVVSEARQAAERTEVPATVTATSELSSLAGYPLAAVPVGSLPVTYLWNGQERDG